VEKLASLLTRHMALLHANGCANVPIVLFGHSLGKNDKNVHNVIPGIPIVNYFIMIFNVCQI